MRRCQAEAEALQQSPDRPAAATSANVNLRISRPILAPGFLTEQTIVQRGLQLTSSLAILQASQRLAERGLVFG